jgi:hypothetical protein
MDGTNLGRLDMDEWIDGLVPNHNMLSRFLVFALMYYVLTYRIGASRIV